jgi:hypothetical protein
MPVIIGTEVFDALTVQAIEAALDMQIGVIRNPAIDDRNSDA